MASSAIVMPTEDKTSINQEQQRRLEEIAGMIISANMSSTECAFVYGKCFAEAKAILPKKEFGGWLKGVSRYTVRSAWNFILVHERLSEHRDMLVSAGCATTELFELAKGEPQAVSELVERIGNGERFNRTQIRSVLGIQANTPKREETELYIGGEVGLQAVVKAKIAQDTAKLRKLMSYILKEVETALLPLEVGKPVVKNSLKIAILQECRDARTMIFTVASPMTLQIETRLYPGYLPEDTPWGRVQSILDWMSSDEKWPVRSKFVPWLQNEVVPLLRFAVHGDPLPDTTNASAVPPELEHVVDEQGAVEAPGFGGQTDRITVATPPLDPVEIVTAEELQSAET